MIRRINFTGRRKLPQHLFKITVENRTPRRFVAEFDISQFKFPPDARLYFEAYSSGSQIVMRFPWGTVGARVPASDCGLYEVPGENVLFNFKVVDESESVGRILAIAKGIPIRSGSDGGGRESLLPVNPAALGHLVWRVSFEHDQPWLEVNNAIPEIMERAKRDPAFLSLVYPAVVREILTEAVIIRGMTDSNELDTWEGKWTNWGSRFHPDRSEPPEFDDDDNSAGREWIDRVVEAFCAYYGTRTSYMSAVGVATEVEP